MLLFLQKVITTARNTYWLWRKTNKSNDFLKSGRKHLKCWNFSIKVYCSFGWLLGFFFTLLPFYPASGNIKSKYGVNRIENNMSYRKHVWHKNFLKMRCCWHALAKNLVMKGKISNRTSCVLPHSSMKDEYSVVKASLINLFPLDQ